MLKRLGLALAGLFTFAQLAFASGTIPYSLSQQLDSLGKPLSGCKLYTIQAGTTSTPQNAYQDSALTLALPNPQTCDAAGRLPQFFLADGSIKVRLTDRNGVTQVVADGIQVIGPSGGGGGGSTVDATTILATGDLKVKYGVGAISGFVRANGRTIGSATSGATERANADCQALFEYLWAADANLVVSTGRGVSANADWVANKALTLPDWRGRVIAGMDDMGNTAAGRLTASYFGSLGTTLGASGGAESLALIASQLPNITPTFTGTAGTVNVTSTASVQGAAFTPSGSSTVYYTSGTTFLNATGTFTPAGTVSGFGGNVPHRTVQPTMLATFYLKL